MRAHFTVLDSWRGLAAMLVAYGHLNVSGELADFLLASRQGGSSISSLCCPVS